jgi:hypothetical protein
MHIRNNGPSTYPTCTPTANAPMDRSDADQEGVTLPPTYGFRALAREEAYKAIAEHTKICPFATEDYSRRIRACEISLARLLGFMAGTGLLGGLVGGLLQHILQTLHN